MALAVASVLTTVTVFTTIEGLLLVLIYVTFLVGSFVDIISMDLLNVYLLSILLAGSNPRFILFPKQSASLVNGIGFMLETLFFWNLQIGLEGTSLRHTIVNCLTASCALLAWFEAMSSSTYQDTLAKFCLCLAMCLKSSWLLHTGLDVLFQESEARDNTITITMFAAHVSVLTVLGILLNLVINKIVLSHISKRDLKDESLFGTSILSYSGSSEPSCKQNTLRFLN